MSLTRAVKTLVTSLGFVTLALAGSWTWGVATAEADVQTLTHLNSVVRIDPHTQAGMFDWVVDGIDHLAKGNSTTFSGGSNIPGQWFWFRTTGTSPEASLDTLTLTTEATFLGGRGLQLLYTSPGLLSVEIIYTLTGGPAGSSISDVAESITISNLMDGEPLNISFFQYTDFDLNGTPGNDTVMLVDPGRFRQTDGGVSATETVVTPLPSHFELATYPITLDKLNNGVATTLCDGIATSSAEGACTPGTTLGPADVTWAWQWDFSIPTGLATTISKDKNIARAVPQPLSLLILGLGLVALAIWSRGRGGLLRLA